jgi:hypothetical protein
MSHWDFGHPADAQQDTSRRSGQAGAACPPDGPERPGGAGDGAWPALDEWPAGEGRAAAPGGRRPDEGWPADGQWSPAADWPPAAGWPPGEDGPADEGWPPAGDGWDDEDGTAPYPLTYERDDFVTAEPQPAAPAAPAREPWEPRLPAPSPAGPGDAGPGGPALDEPGGRRWTARWGEAAGGGRRGAEAAAGAWTGQDPGLPDEDLAAGGPGEEDPAEWGTGPGGRRWLIPAGLAVAGAAVGAAAVLLIGGHPGAQGPQGAPGSQGAGGGAAPPAAPGTARSAPGTARSAPAGTARGAQASTAPSPPPAGPLTMTQAKAVLAGYTTANNGANAQRSDTLLASVESGSSYAIDAGLYQNQRAAGTAPYPAFSPVQATYYIPRDEPASGPRWFVVQVGNAFTADPGKVTSTEYLLFTQQSPGGAWQDALEPYLLAGASVPPIALSADGLATSVDPDAAAVAVAPGQLPAATAAALDGTGAGDGPAAIANPGNLADYGDQRFWQGKISGGSVTDAHAPAAGAAGQEFALRTADGGALVFYTDAAEVTITPPAGSALHLTLPGFYSPDQALPRAGMSYLEQFTAYDPPADGGAGGAPRVVADYSGITGKN